MEQGGYRWSRVVIGGGHVWSETLCSRAVIGGGHVWSETLCSRVVIGGGRVVYIGTLGFLQTGFHVYDAMGSRRFVRHADRPLRRRCVCAGWRKPSRMSSDRSSSRGSCVPAVVLPLSLRTTGPRSHHTMSCVTRTLCSGSGGRGIWILEQFVDVVFIHL